MKKKEEEIIKAGMKLFANKGFSTTSIQEIADESNISKGSFYLYFKTKDEFILAILKYNFETIEERMSKYEQQNVAPRKKFEKQLTAIFETLMEHRGFFIMLSTEQLLPTNEVIKEVIYKNFYESYQFYRAGLSSVYGERIHPYLEDLTIILEGLFHSYLRLILVDPDGSKADELTSFIMRRMDSMARDITNDQPFLTEKKMKDVFSKSKMMLEKKDIKRVIEQMKNELNKLDNSSELAVSLEVLEEEIRKDTPRIPVIQGMLSNFANIDSLKKYRQEIASHYGFDLE